MDVITGKTRPDAGTAFFGQTIDLAQLTEAEIAHAGIGRKFQKPTVFEHQVFENLGWPAKAKKAALAAQSGRARPGRRIGEVMETVGLTVRATTWRVRIARAKAVAGDRNAADQEPKLLLLDDRWPD
jgi:urea transport system ATP-binding protein